MRHTKIIATVGPSSDRPETLEALIEAGVNVFRLNFSHGTHDGHAESFQRIRTASRACGQHVAIMQDLSGPKIRTGPLRGMPRSRSSPETSSGSLKATRRAGRASCSRRSPS